MAEAPPEPAAIEQPDTTPVDTIPIDPHPTSDEETLFFGLIDPDDQARRKLKLLNDRIDQDNALSKDYARKAFGFATAWLVFLMLFITARPPSPRSGGRCRTRPSSQW